MMEIFWRVLMIVGGLALWITSARLFVAAGLEDDEVWFQLKLVAEIAAFLLGLFLICFGFGIIS